MGRYETFVLRIWIEDSTAAGHGEIRHLASGIGLRLRHIEEAMKFIERFSSESAEERTHKPPRPASG
jgi:hypothetical protein